MEANGTSLTILSLLARLGKDPWTEAAAWSTKPREAAIESLAESILQMPPNPQALDDAHLTAARLVLLLPTLGTSLASGTLTTVPAGKPRAVLLLLGWFSLFVAFNIFALAGPRPDIAATLAAHPVVASTK